MSRSILDLLIGAVGDPAAAAFPGIRGSSVLTAIISEDGKPEINTVVNLRADLPVAPAAEVSEDEWLSLYNQLLKSIENFVMVLRCDGRYTAYEEDADVLDELARHLRDEHCAEDFAFCNVSLDELLEAAELLRESFDDNGFKDEQAPFAELKAIEDAVEAVTLAGKSSAVTDSFYGIPIKGEPKAVKELKDRLYELVKAEIRQAQIAAGDSLGLVQDKVSGAEALVRKGENGEIEESFILAGSAPEFVTELQNILRSSLAAFESFNQDARKEEAAAV